MRRRTFFDVKLFAGLLVGALTVVMVGMAAQRPDPSLASEPVYIQESSVTLASFP